MTVNTATTVTPTVSNLEYSVGLKLVNALARASEAVGLGLGRLDGDSILAAARRQSGLEDLGDLRFVTPMNRALDALAERPLTPLGRLIIRQSFIRAAQNRLEAEAWVARRPQVLEQPVQRPIFVLGFPRTGTTLLQNLLALEPGRRGLPFWELTLPVPVHADPATDRESRRSTARMMLAAAYRAAPEMSAVHAIDVDTLEECWPLFANSFSVVNWELQSGLDRYGDFLQSEWDMRLAYGEYKRYLQILLERNPAEQLVLKCPEHLWFVDELLDTFPDACIVWTHRDPYDTIASYCSLISLQWRTLFGRIDRPEIGEFMERRLLRGIERALDARTRRDPARFFDVRFDDLVADPAGLVRRLSDHFELPLAPDHPERVAAYLGKKRADDRGQHKYDGRLYGLDRDEVRARYARYVEAVGLAPTR